MKCWSDGVRKYRSIGVMEYWGAGVMPEGLMSFFNTPILRHSITPVLDLWFMDPNNKTE
jgi:hypothetical protein